MFIHDGPPGAKVKKRLGELLMELDLLTQAQLDEVLAAQKTDKRRLGVLLVEKKIITATKLTQVLSYQFNLPFVSLAQVRYTPALVSRIPGAFAKQRRVVPIVVSGGDVLFAATDDPADESLSADLAKQCGMEIRLMVAVPDEVQSVLDAHYQQFPSRRPPPPVASPGVTGAVRAAVSEHPPPLDLEAAEPVELTGADLELIEGQEAEAGPVALCLGSSPSFVSLCVEAAKKQGLRIEHTTPADAARKARELSPVALVVLEDLFARYRVMLTQLSIDAGAHLVIWSNQLEPRYLEGLFAAVSGHSSRSRA
jgi:hypothetical protein